MRTDSVRMNLRPSPFCCDRAACRTCWHRSCSRLRKTSRVQVFESGIVGSSYFNISLDGWALALPYTRAPVTQGRSLEHWLGTPGPPGSLVGGEKRRTKRKLVLSVKVCSTSKRPEGPRFPHRRRGALPSLFQLVEAILQVISRKGFTPSKLPTSARCLRLRCLTATCLVFDGDGVTSSD